jgi:hypothetical protein
MGAADFKLSLNGDVTAPAFLPNTFARPLSIFRYHGICDASLCMRTLRTRDIRPSCTTHRRVLQFSDLVLCLCVPTARAELRVHR